MASDAGWLLGARSDRSSYRHPLAFVVIHYRTPDFARHLRRVADERPSYAVAPDLSDAEVCKADVARALAQTDELPHYCERPLIVPKLSGQLALIPSRHAIAYSVPSSYGGAQHGPWQLRGRRVHLLGGSPSTQRRIYRHLRADADVMSVDGNMAQKVLGKLTYWSRRNVWEKTPMDSEYMDCWLTSLANIWRMWLAEFGTECETRLAEELRGGYLTSMQDVGGDQVIFKFKPRAVASNLLPSDLEPGIASRLQDRMLGAALLMAGPDFRLKRAR